VEEVEEDMTGSEDADSESSLVGSVRSESNVIDFMRNQESFFSDVMDSAVKAGGTKSLAVCLHSYFSLCVDLILFSSVRSESKDRLLYQKSHAVRPCCFLCKGNSRGRLPMCVRLRTLRRRRKTRWRKGTRSLK
jgi:hypothetical protein